MEKTIKARVQHKHDVEANWLKATNFIPLVSEIIVYDPDENYDYPRIKIGDGKTNINTLPFVTKDYAKINDIPTKPEDIGALPDTTKIPSTLSDLTADSTHRTVTDTEKSTWNAKANASDIPTKVSQLTNDSDFTTKNYVDNSIAAIDVPSGFVAQSEAPEDKSLLWIDVDDEAEEISGMIPVKGVDYFIEADKEEFLGEMDAVRYVEQTLTDTQKAQARQNIGVIGTGDTGYSVLTAPKFALVSSDRVLPSMINVPSGYTPKAGDLLLLDNGAMYRIIGEETPPDAETVYKVLNFATMRGTDAKTPVKGTDYYTEADKAEMVEAVKESLDGIPDYWKDHLDEKIALIREAMLTAGFNKSAFFFYSDAYWSNATTYTAKKAPTLLKYLYKNTPINKTNFGGDIVQAESTDADTMAYLWEWRNQLYGLPNHHSVPGNHDDGNHTDNLFSENYVYGYLLAPEETADIVRGDSGFYYYIDNPTERTRYLYLDTMYQGVTAAEQEFVKKALLSTPENWHIVAIAHAWYANDYGTVENPIYPPILVGFDTNAKKLLDMFDNFNARQGEFADCTAWVEFCIGGHYHLDHVEHTGGGIPVIIVEADTLHDRSGTMPQAGTTDESAISAVIADYNTKTVKIIRVGRGEDYETRINVKTVSYTNVIPLSIDKDGTPFADGKGWMANSRVGSGGLYAGNQTPGTDGAQWVTGYIEIDPSDDIIVRLKNVTFDSSANNGNHGVFFFNENFARTYLGSSTTNTHITLSGLASGSYACDPVLDDTNLVQFRLDREHGYVLNDNIKYMVICCGGLSDDSIITINEPIE